MSNLLDDEQEGIVSDPKFIARYTLGLFCLANWLYNTLIVGPEGIADFSTISDGVFNDKMFFVGAYKQISDLVADLSDPRIVTEMMESKTLLLDRHKLKEMFSLDETKMKSLAEQGVSVYSMLVAKKLAENTIFDEDIVPESYTTIDGTDKSASDLSVPISLVFSVDSDLLDRISRLLSLNDTTIVSETLAELAKDDKMGCFKNSFEFISRIDSTL
jgi:hypothetical protein